MNAMREQLKQQPDGQISLTDPDARSMVSQAKGTGVVGYNVQAVVDAQHHLIVTHEVTNVGSDRAQLTKMGTAGKGALGKEHLQAVADRGYFSGPEIKACTEANITPLVPKPMTSNAKAEGRFSKADFIYIAKENEYQCPAGERAIHRFATVEHGLTLHKYWSSACPRCPLKRQCTTSSYRRIARWEHEAVLEAMQCQLDRNPEAMTLRRRTIEHVFGTLKHWMGSTHFLTRGLEHVGTEMALRAGLQLQARDQAARHGQNDEVDAARRRLRAHISRHREPQPPRSLRHHPIANAVCTPINHDNPIYPTRFHTVLYGHRPVCQVDLDVMQDKVLAAVLYPYMDAPGLPSFQFVKARRSRLHPYIRTVCAATPLSLMEFAGWRLNRHSRTSRAPDISGFANHGLTWLAITS